MTARAASNGAGGYDYHCPTHENFKGTVSSPGDAVAELRKHDRAMHAPATVVAMKDSPERIAAIKERLAVPGVLQRDIAAEFKVSVGVVSDINRGLLVAS